MNYELERISKEVVVKEYKQSQGICLGGRLRKSKESHSQESTCPSQEMD
jgi:hypothetical protein